MRHNFPKERIRVGKDEDRSITFNQSHDKFQLRKEIDTGKLLDMMQWKFHGYIYWENMIWEVGDWTF